MEILESRAKLDATRMANTSLFEKKSSVISTLLDPSVFKPLTIINIFNFLQLLSGTFIMVFYAVNLVTNIGKRNLHIKYIYIKFKIENDSRIF